jgi:hypothetical protein
MKIDFHFVCDMVASRTLDIQFLSSRDQLADIFIKPLSIAHFSLLQSKLNAMPLPLTLKGHVNVVFTHSNVADTKATLPPEKHPRDEAHQDYGSQEQLCQQETRS